MELNDIKLKELIKADYNPGEMLPSEYLKLKGSIESFGFLKPITYYVPTGLIIDGHHRYDALDEKGIENLKTIELGDIGFAFLQEDIKIKDENELKAMNIALRKIRGDFNYTKLEEIFTDLKLDHFNLELTGFDEMEIDSLTVDTNFGFNDDSDNGFGEGGSDDDAENIQGDAPGRSYTVHIAFDTIEKGNQFLKSIGVDDEFTGLTKLVNGEELDL